jgi:NAD(P)-dependent dehydrogenase (short-subunit alcohol dehydrogenase family)
VSQKILITGTSSGFGKLIAESLLAKGHTVVATMRGVDGKNAAAAAELKAAGAHIVELDVTDDASVDAGVAAAIKAAGGLDVVVNNAGAGVVGLQEDFTPEDWKKIFNINVFGVQRVNRAALPYLREQGSGLLIHVSSLLGRFVLPFFGPYNASKWALEAMAENYRVELSGFGVDSVIVEPGGYGTDFMANCVRPSDSSRQASYGEMAGAPDAMLASFEQNYDRDDAPDPQWIADSVTGLIEAPAGERPFRTVRDGLGMAEPIEKINAASDEAMKGIYSAFQMDSMLQLNTAARA